MSSTTATSSNTNENALPIHTSSSNYTTAVTNKIEQDKLGNATVKVRDGRRNSVGEELPSPVETWKPNLARQQSWNQQDLKRRFVLTELEKEKAGANSGFSEVGK